MRSEGGKCFAKLIRQRNESVSFRAGSRMYFMVTGDGQLSPASARGINAGDEFDQGSSHKDGGKAKRTSRKALEQEIKNSTKRYREK